MAFNHQEKVLIQTMDCNLPACLTFWQGCFALAAVSGWNQLFWGHGVCLPCVSRSHHWQDKLCAVAWWKWELRLPAVKYFVLHVHSMYLLLYASTVSTRLVTSACQAEITFLAHVNVCALCKCWHMVTPWHLVVTSSIVRARGFLLSCSCGWTCTQDVVSIVVA